MIRWLVTVSVLISAAALAPLTNPQPAVEVIDNRARLEFPDRITFDADFKSNTPIQRVVLEYGVDQQTCGQVVAKAFPDITPGDSVSASWTWEMLQTGSQPPGATIWWRWRLTDAQGKDTLTSDQTVIWLDDQHAWQTISGGSINLHWYNGDQAFGRELHDSAVKSLADLAQATGLRTTAPIDLYIYGNVQDMRDAILYEPGWTGGLAFSDYDIVLIGIAPDDIEWGKRTQAHELTHMLAGQLTFSCLSDIPTWLQEGLAVYGEGGPEAASRDQLNQAIRANTLLSIRSLSGNFSEDPAKADLSYSQSYSVVNFLIEQYGQDRMRTLLDALKQGQTVDEALQTAYGFNVDGLDDAWRAHVKARPRPNAGAQPTATPAPTEVPTFVPISIAQAAPTMAPTRARPTPTPIVVSQAPPAESPTKPIEPQAAPDNAPNSAPNMTLIFILVGAVGVIVGIVVVMVINRRRQRLVP